MSGWQFDHLNLAVSQPEPLLRFFAEVLGWQDGYRPAFPVPGRWLYQGDQALLHLLPESGAAPQARLAHIAFRGDESAEVVLARLRASGYPWQARPHPDKPAAQLFVQLPGGLVLELEAPLSGPLPGLQPYDDHPDFRFEEQ